MSIRDKHYKHRDCKYYGDGKKCHSAENMPQPDGNACLYGKFEPKVKK